MLDKKTVRLISRKLSPLLIVLGVLLVASNQASAFDNSLEHINLPSGFNIEIYTHVPNARSMALDSESGTLYVGTRKSEVYAVTNDDSTKERKVIKLLSGLNGPNGIALNDGYLYVAEQDKIDRYKVVDSNQSAPQLKNKKTIYSDLPNKSHHGWRYIAFGPDNRLYVTVGSPCNICKPEGIEGTIISMDTNGKDMQVFATGIRNSVGIDFNPITKVMHFTDNGADGMGDDIPSDELNAAPIPGKDYGFPYFGGGSVRTNQSSGGEVINSIPPVIEFGAHTANLGIHFYTANQFPQEYRNDALVAEHGSWNRSTPDGYRIMRVRFDQKGNATDQEVFADGWLQNGNVSGQPVDIKQLADGSLLVSDDYAGVIYRISFNQN